MRRAGRRERAASQPIDPRGHGQVTANGRHLGSVVIEGNLSLLYAWMRIQAFVILGALLGGTLVALSLTRLLQRAISSPVLDLAATADRVSTRRDYSLRATQTTGDEVGGLVQSFNGMLDEIQRQNEALTVEIAERKRAEYLKDEFLAAVSHELRTPLNAILGWLQILRTTDGGEDRLERALESLERNARSQARVIEDLLDVSRMVTGKLQVKMDVVDLCAVLAAAVDAVKPTATAKSLQLALDLPPTPCLASADRDRLQQVAWNLLSNAVKFTPRGGSSTSRCRPSGAGLRPFRARYGHRHHAGLPALRVRPFSSGGRLDDAAARRSRPRPGHRQGGHRAAQWLGQRRRVPGPDAARRSRFVCRSSSASGQPDVALDDGHAPARPVEPAPVVGRSDSRRRR